MIRILKKGKRPETARRVYKATCQTCGCVFEFEAEDCRFDRASGCAVVECPTCENEISGQLSRDFSYEDHIAGERVEQRDWIQIKDLFGGKQSMLWDDVVNYYSVDGVEQHSSDDGYVLQNKRYFDNF